MKVMPAYSSDDIRLKYFSRRVVKRYDGIIQDLMLLGLHRGAEILSAKKNLLMISLVYETRSDKDLLDQYEMNIIQQALTDPGNVYEEDQYGPGERK